MKHSVVHDLLAFGILRGGVQRIAGHGERDDGMRKHQTGQAIPRQVEVKQTEYHIGEAARQRWQPVAGQNQCFHAAKWAQVVRH